MQAADIDITLTEHMRVDLWKKFVLLSGTSGITASTRQPMGVIRENEELMSALMRATAFVSVGVSRMAERRLVAFRLYLATRGKGRSNHAPDWPCSGWSCNQYFFFFFLIIRRPPRFTLFPYPALFRSIQIRSNRSSGQWMGQPGSLPAISMTSRGMAAWCQTISAGDGAAITTAASAASSSSAYA